MSAYDDYLARGRARYGDRFDSSHLAPQFVAYYNSGQRIVVDLGYDEPSRGYVGVTTGWCPSFLLLNNTRSSGSSYLLSNDDHVLAGLDRYRNV